ncbi:MAG: CARDB domain-containing protein [Candidatus Bathyarchaeia archaeon]
MRRPPILAALLVSILLQLIPFMYVQAQSKPEWAAKGVYLTYSWELWEYCPVEEVNSKIEEMKGRISELFKFILIQVDDEKGIFTITVGEKSTNDEFFWEDAHWKTLEAFPLYYPSAKLQNAPIVQLSMALGTYRVYKLTKEPEEYAMGPTLYFHEELHILLLGVSLSKAKPDPFTGKLSQDVSVVQLVDTNIPIGARASDLTIISLSASPLKTSRLGTLTVSFTEKNQGSINSGTFVTRIYLGKTERALDYLIGETEMHSLKAGETRIFNLELRIPNTVPSGSYRVVVYADYFNELGEANEENNVVSTSDKVTIALYELFIEIDYMLGHRPTQSVLNYIEDYFLQRDVLVTFHVDDEVPLDLEVTREEFFSFEMQYNDMGDDKIVYNWWGREYKFTSKWKWVLFGTMDAEDGANGYTYCAHDDGGNYIFISDESNDELAFMLRNQNVTPEKVETVVLMHELGHSIGILRIDENGDQVYDSDWWSVMARLSPINCNANPIRYSQEYWALRNMESYIIT